MCGACNAPCQRLFAMLVLAEGFRRAGEVEASLELLRPRLLSLALMRLTLSFVSIFGQRRMEDEWGVPPDEWPAC